MEEIHLHIHLHNKQDEEILHNVFTLTKSIHDQNFKIMNELETLQQEVAETKTVMQSAKTLIIGLKERLDAAGTDPVKLKAMSDDLDQGANDLAAAVAANTPADGGTGTGGEVFGEGPGGGQAGGTL